MKRLCFSVLACAVLLTGLVGCGKQDEMEEEKVRETEEAEFEEDEELPDEWKEIMESREGGLKGIFHRVAAKAKKEKEDTDEYETDEYETEPLETEPDSSDVFRELPSEFIFTSGAGGWSTTILLNDDGTFTGSFMDTDMGDFGDDYPNGTTYVCDFNGKFTSPQQMDEYTYSMKLEYLDSEGTVGDEYYENEMRYIFSDPYGFDYADDFLLYFPGIRMDDLPEEFKIWLYAFPDTYGAEILPYYGIYNVGGEEGFVAFESEMYDEETDDWESTANGMEEETNPVEQVDVEAAVKEIRELYYGVQNNLGSFEQQDGGGGTTRYLDKEGNIVKISVGKGAYDPSDLSEKYAAEYFYEITDHGYRPRFVFVYGQNEEYRIYLTKGGNCVRYIDDKGTIYDYENPISQDALAQITEMQEFCTKAEMEIVWALE